MPTTAPLSASGGTASQSDPRLDICEAAEIRDSTGRRRFGSMYTIRRRLKDGSLPHERDNGKYFLRLSALEGLERTKTAPDPVTAAFAELEIAANRLVAKCGPLTDEQCELIADRLRGATR